MNSALYIVTFINFINALSFTLMLPNIYGYGRYFGLNDLETSLLFITSSIAQFFATPIIGKLSDRFGRKPLLILSLAGTIIANFTTGTANTSGILFFARFLDGITGGNVSVAQAIITDITKPEDRTRTFGLFGASLGVGFIAGSFISYFATKISINTPFLASSIFATIALILTIFQLPETLEFTTKESGEGFDMGLKNIISGLMLRGIGTLLIITFFSNITFTMFIFAFQPYYFKVLGQNMNSISLLFLSFGVFGVFTQTQGIKFLNKKLSATQVMLLGLFFRGACFILMPLINNVVYFIAVSLVFSISNSLVQPIVSSLISINTKPSEQGMTSGLNAAYLSISGIGPVFSALLIDQVNIEAAEKLAAKTGMMVNISSYTSYSYPLYVAGIFSFYVFLFAIMSQDQYKDSVARM
jgi:MFS family permease